VFSARVWDLKISQGVWPYRILVPIAKAESKN
jgi:hypothetical protein